MSTPFTVTEIAPFGQMPDGTPIPQWELDNGHGLRARVIGLGGVITHLFVPDKHEKPGNILLGVDRVEPILSDTTPYFGSLIGRVGNRIRNSTFTLDGQTYHLAANRDPNHLHGGNVGYDKRLWHIAPMACTEGAAIQLSLTDPAGTEGYPGTVQVRVCYTLTAAGAWRIDYEATTDAPTPINLTQHAYFNLRDGGRHVIDDHLVQIHAEQFTPLGPDLVPTGEIRPVADSIYDFRQPKRIGQDLHQVPSDPVGYDYNYIITGPSGTLRPAAEVYEPHSGRVMQVHTTEPAMQFYTGNFLDGSITGHEGIAYKQHAGFCMETQHYPDAPNQPTFPSIILRPGHTFRSTTEYRFSTRT